jgi:hypothetical protein
VERLEMVDSADLPSDATQAVRVIFNNNMPYELAGKEIVFAFDTSIDNGDQHTSGASKKVVWIPSTSVPCKYLPSTWKGSPNICS